MTHADLENVYETLAKEIDAVGPENSEVFLAKLALLLAQRLGDVDVALASIADAAKSLEKT